MSVKQQILELKIEAALVARVHELGGLAEKVTVIGRRGFFDRLLILPGARVIFVELKRPRGGRLSAHQKARHVRYHELGVTVALVKSLEDIDRLLGPKK